MPTYETLKAIHVLGVVLFLGNVTITAVWKYYADRTRNPAVVGFAQRLVTLTDWVFTFGGVVLVAIGGYGMAAHNGYDLLHGPHWILIGQALFIISGLIWAIVLIPIQIRQARLAHSFENGGKIPDLYWRLNRHWFVWGIIATIIPALNIAVMTLKP